MLIKFKIEVNFIYVSFIFSYLLSAMVAKELFYRAGGLAVADPIIDTDITIAHGVYRSTLLEGVVGYAKVLLKWARVKENDVVLVIFTSSVKCISR